MTEQIISREEISLDAKAAAQRYVATSVEQDCPFVSGTEASREWRREYQIYQIALLKLPAQGVK